MTVVLSPAGGARRRATAPAPGTVATCAPSLLLVDRQPLFLEALGSLLRQPPLSALTRATTGSDLTAQMVEAARPDLVVCDLNAEPLDGRAILRAMLELRPPVPVIILGELVEMVLAVGLMLEGAAGLFIKECAQAELVTGVVAVLDGHRAVSAELLEAAIAGPHRRGAVPGSPAENLSPTELEVLAQLGQARSVAAIARARTVSEKTVRNHIAAIYRKLSLRNRTEAVLLAARWGLIPNS